MSDSPSFVASLNHELRNPLNAIVGLTDLALLTSANDSQAQYLATIKRAAGALERILNETSQYGELERLGAGPFAGEAESFSLRQLFDEAATRWSDLTAAASVPLAVRVDASVPATLAGHPQRLSQLLDCLVGHALQHTQQGQIELAAVMSDREADSTLHITVQDTGYAVEAEKLERLFVPFSKVRRAADHKHGAVLSLPIAALVVRGLRGKIHARSLAGGLAIECSLPIGNSARETAACVSS